MTITTSKTTTCQYSSSTKIELITVNLGTVDLGTCIGDAVYLGTSFGAIVDLVTVNL